MDLLELAGSQEKAAVTLNIHQSTVCRSLQLLQRQLQLVKQPGARVCRYGHNSCLEHLRLAYREHRLMEGLLRIGSDVLHQSLLLALPGVQLVPPRFRSAGHWLELLRHGLLDGVLLSSFCLNTPLRPRQRLGWDGMVVLPLAQLTLQLVATTAQTRRVLLPARTALPLLHQAIAAEGLAVEQQPAACQEQRAWLKRARDRQLALPLCPPLVGADWLAKHRLVPLPQQPALVEQLWLVQPQTAADTPAARQCLRRLRARLNRAERYAKTA
ncbi:MAG: hypothetical protein ACKO7Z_07580 [Cyanobacteriota bacterium]